MKLKENLADDYEYNWHTQHGPGATEDLFGYRKAEVLAQCEIRELGEEEVT